MTRAMQFVGPELPLPATDAYIPELDGLRAVAVMLVVAGHYRLLPFVPSGFGVTLFFFLSGYLITTLFYSEFAQRRSISISQFYLRRWLRLTPPLLLLVALGTLFPGFSRTAVGGDPVPAGTIWSALLYYTNYYDLANNVDDTIIIPFGICWSLAIEEHFYIAWPLLVRWQALRPERLLGIVATVCVVVLGWRIVAREVFSFPTEYTYMATDCRIDSILYGAMLRVLLQTRWSASAFRLLRSPVASLLGMGILLSTFLVRSEDFRQTVRYSLQELALMPVFVLVLSSRLSLLKRVLGSGPMVLVGRLSYAIYLFHLIARTPAEVYFGTPYGLFPAASGLATTFTIAIVLLVTVERPIARLRRGLRIRLMQANEPRTASVSQAPDRVATPDPART